MVGLGVSFLGGVSFILCCTPVSVSAAPKPVRVVLNTTPICYKEYVSTATGSRQRVKTIEPQQPLQQQPPPVLLDPEWDLCEEADLAYTKLLDTLV